MLTLILPSYNVAPYIRECVESALNQTLDGIEILCVDAGSEDGTTEILREYEKRVSQGEWAGKSLKVIISDKKSYGYQVNLALSRAMSKYVAVLETDDFVLPDMYETLVELSEEMELDYIRGEHVYFTTGGDGSREFHRVHNYAPTEVLLTDTRSEVIMTYDQNLWKGIYRREFLMQNNIRLNESKGAAFQDIGFNMQVFSYAKRAFYLNKPFYCYRRDRTGSSIHSEQALAFYTWELEFLHETDPQTEKLYWPGIYERFACAMCGEYHKVKENIGNLEKYFVILSRDFEKALKNGIWPAPQTPNGQIKAVKEIIEKFA